MPKCSKCFFTWIRRTNPGAIAFREPISAMVSTHHHSRPDVWQLASYIKNPLLLRLLSLDCCCCCCCTRLDSNRLNSSTTYHRYTQRLGQIDCADASDEIGCGKSFYIFFAFYEYYFYYYYYYFYYYYYYYYEMRVYKWYNGTSASVQSVLVVVDGAFNIML